MNKINIKTKKVFIAADKVCDRRKIDAQRYSTYFKKNGYKIITNPKKADLIVIFTCGTTNELAEISFKYIEELKKLGKEMIVSGCLPDTDKEKLAKEFNGKTTSSKNLEEIDNIFPDNKRHFNKLKDENIPLLNMDERRIGNKIKRVIIKSKIGKKTYVYFVDSIAKFILGKNYLIGHNFLNLPIDDYYLIRISQGCMDNCAYCATKKAIGKHISKPLEEVIQEFKDGLKKGHSNFVLSGDDSGAYGIDINSSFSELLNKITEIKGEYKITIQAVNPRWLVKYVDELEPIIKTGKIKIISFPIQSGNDRILKMMHRYSDPEKIKEAFIRLREAYPKLIFDTHAIVGFPTETEQEFMDTLNLVKDVGFDFGVLIPISIRPDTEIENIEPKLSDQEVKNRLKIGKKYLKNQGFFTYGRKAVLFGKKTKRA